MSAPDRDDRFDRAHDELHLMMLNCWDEGWSAGEISTALEVTRSTALGVIHRVGKADPDALTRKPEPGSRRSAA